MERNVEEKLQSITFLWIWLMEQMATVCKNFIYVLPEKVVTRSACMSWAIKEENVQSMSSSSLDPQDECSAPLWSLEGMTQPAVDVRWLNKNTKSNSKMLLKIYFYSPNNSIQSWK